MNEAFLHYLFDQRKLGNSFLTTQGYSLDVTKFGVLNKNAGPDFLESQIRYDDKIWAGHIEFHLNSSDWMKHKHQNDKAYNNVIAHFVFNHDKEVHINKFQLPVVELKHLIKKDEFLKYQKLIASKAWIPCQNQIGKVSPLLIHQQIENASLKRLDRKAIEVLKILKNNRGDKNKTAFQLIARALGGKVNAEAFEKLVNKIEVRILAHLNYDPVRIQALMHGLSGLLPAESTANSYVSILQKEYTHLVNLFSLNAMVASEWRFSSIRPQGSPTIRIAQLAALFSKRDFIQDLEFQNSTSINESLNINLNPFWTTHYNFNRQTNIKSYGLSKAIKNSILINAIIPYNYAISIERGDLELKKWTLDCLKNVAPERNNIIDKWRQLKIEANTAFESQGLLEQKNELCNQKKCLFCSIGKHLLKL